MAMHRDHRQAPLFPPESSWVAPADFPDWKSAKRLSIDTETHDEGISAKKGSAWPWQGGEVIGFSVAVDDVAPRYYPLAHPEGNCDREKALAWLADLLNGYEGDVVGMNLMYDLGWLGCYGITPRKARRFWDIMFVEALLDEHRDSYSMQNIARTYGLSGKDERLLEQAAAAYGLKDCKGEMFRLPARFVGPYGEMDAALPLAIMDKQLPRVAADDLGNITDLEHKLILPLVDMRRHGVRVDLDKAEQARVNFTLKAEAHLAELKSLTGRSVDIWANHSIATVLLEAGIKFPVTALGAPSFEAEWLDHIEHPVCKHLVKARKYDKAANTFCKNMVLEMAHNCRVHPEFHPLRSDDGGTVSGRFACISPNLQQVPARDPEIGAAIRSLFLPEEGEQWAACDWSQQEPRLTVHFAGLLNLPGALEAVRQFNDDPSTDYHTMVAGITGLPRKKAKTINLGIAYGMGGGKLCRNLGLPTEMKTRRDGTTYEGAGPEGQGMIDTYHERLPFVRALSKACGSRAEQRGFLRTLAGRRCRFLHWEPINGRGPGLRRAEAEKRYGAANIRLAGVHKALNRLIQGSAADMIKISLITLAREGMLPLVTVHDENGFSVPDRAAALRRAEIMRDCVPLSVPMKVDVDLGPSWGEAKELEG